MVVPLATWRREQRDGHGRIAPVACPVTCTASYSPETEGFGPYRVVTQNTLARVAPLARVVVAGRLPSVTVDDHVADQSSLGLEEADLAVGQIGKAGFDVRGDRTRSVACAVAAMIRS